MINIDIIKSLMINDKNIINSFEYLTKELKNLRVVRENIQYIELYNYKKTKISHHKLNNIFNINMSKSYKIKVEIYDIEICFIKVYVSNNSDYISEITLELFKKLLEKQLELSITNLYQEIILDHLPKGILILDKNGKIQFLNLEGANILSVCRESSKDLHITEIVDFEPTILNVLKTGEGYRNKELIVNNKGKKMNFIKSATPIKNQDGGIVGIVDTFERINDVKKVVNKITGAYAKFKFDDIIGENNKFLECIRIAKIASKSSSNVLIFGESGTGKELCAHAIHNASIRRKYPFISINCAAIPRDLLESELFGYVEGSFTGALKKGRVGKFELAQKGTIFLDEIGDMPLDMQVKILRVLQDKKISRIGSEYLIDVDIRIICATNKNLFDLCEEGFFRKDLYYRLNVLNIVMTPLRERKDDIVKLTNFFLNKFNKQLEKNIKRVHPDVFKVFNEYKWPGNVRELENIIERGVNICQTNEITIDHLDNELFKSNIILNNQSKYINSNKNLKAEKAEYTIKTIAELENEAIQQALEIYNGNISEAAKALGITRNTIYNKMKKYVCL